MCVENLGNFFLTCQMLVFIVLSSVKLCLSDNNCPLSKATVVPHCNIIAEHISNRQNNHAADAMLFQDPISTQVYMYVCPQNSQFVYYGFETSLVDLLLFVVLYFEHLQEGFLYSIAGKLTARKFEG